MMKSLLSIIFLVFCVFSYAQVSIYVEPNPSATHGEPDESDIEADAIIVNDGGRELSLLWIRHEVDKPDEWDSWVCDNNLCYFAGVSACPVNNPVILPAGDTAILQMHVDPKGIDGCATIQIDLVTVDNPETVLDAGIFHFDVNGGICNFSTGINEVDGSELSILPNPTQDIFTISGRTDVERVEVYSVVGKLVRTYEDTSNNEFYVGDMHKGMYLISMLNDKGQILKTVRLSKM